MIEDYINGGVALKQKCFAFVSRLQRGEIGFINFENSTLSFEQRYAYRRGTLVRSIVYCGKNYFITFIIVTVAIFCVLSMSLFPLVICETLFFILTCTFVLLCMEAQSRFDFAR